MSLPAPFSQNTVTGCTWQHLTLKQGSAGALFDAKLGGTVDSLEGREALQGGGDGSDHGVITSRNKGWITVPGDVKRVGTKEGNRW